MIRTVVFASLLVLGVWLDVVAAEDALPVTGVPQERLAQPRRATRHADKTTHPGLGSEPPAPARSRRSEVGQDRPVIRLWPIELVGGEPNRLKEEYREQNGRKQLSVIRDPNLTVYQAENAKPTAALVYCPGGAYRILGMPSEERLTRWTDLGITVFVLKYTIPEDLDAAFKDVQRAMRLVRHQAERWNIDPNRVGLFGNSAGGHLSARLSQNYAQPAYDPIDEADRSSCEPDFVVLQCAAYFFGRPPGAELDGDLFHMTNKVAPTFLTYARDDKFCEGGVAYEKALRDAGHATRIKLFDQGGHGMKGCDWFPAARDWLREQHVIKQ